MCYIADRGSSKVKDTLVRIISIAEMCEMRNETCPYDYTSCDVCYERWEEMLREAFEVDKVIKVEVNINGETVTSAKVKGW